MPQLRFGIRESIASAENQEGTFTRYYDQGVGREKEPRGSYDPRRFSMHVIEGASRTVIGLAHAAQFSRKARYSWCD